MVKAIILNKHFAYLETLNGTYRDGTFTYKKNSKASLNPLGFLFKNNDEYDTLVFEYEKLIPIPTGKGFENVASYQWDGKNCTQLTFDQIAQSNGAVDYQKNFKLSEAIENTIWKNPLANTENTMRWLGIILLLVVTIAAVWSGIQNGNRIAKAATPFAQIATEVSAQQVIMSNQITQLIALQNATLHYEENVTAYLIPRTG